MDDVRRRLTVLVIAALGAFGLLAAAAQAAPKAAAAHSPVNQCIVHSLPSFIDQGLEGSASSVADIVEIECNPSEYDGKIRISDVELYDRCGKHLSWSPTFEFKSTEGPATEVKLDDDGGATVVLWGGPECKPGESQIMIDETGFPNETYMTPFTVLPPEETPEGVYALPSSQVEDDVFSSVATIVEVEFPGIAEQKVALNAEQILDRCGKAPHVVWVGPDEKVLKTGGGRLEGPTALETDDDGNAFVVLLGARSCQPGKVVIEASLEEVLFTTVNTTFTIEGPRPTLEESFVVKKEQKIGGGLFTTEKIIGNLGETVDYKIIVENTGNVALNLTNIEDTKCTNIKGPAKAEVAPGESTFYTCEHKLEAVGAWINQATVENSTGKKKESNKVVAEAFGEGFIVEKEQKLPGEEFTKAKLKGKLGETVEYRIVVTNTGTVVITLEPFSDPDCTGIEGPAPAVLAPKEHAVYTCRHELTEVGTWTNVATVETITHKKGESEKVEVEVPKPSPEAITVEKKQKLPGEPGYIEARLRGMLGETVSYQITVTNSGTVAVTLAKIKDENCEKIIGPSKGVLTPGEHAEYTCVHELTAYGIWINTAEVETTKHLSEKSNKVEVEVPEPFGPEFFSVEKQQKLSAGAYTKSKLVTTLGETVDYKIIVTNTGKSVVHLTAIKDSNCTNIVGPAKAELGLGESTFYTCEHKLTSAGVWPNEAIVESAKQMEQSNKVEVEATEFGEPAHTTESSNKVESVVAKGQAKPVCAVSASVFKLAGGTGSKRKPFNVSVSAVGIKEVTFFLGGHKLKTLKKAQARHGRLTITIRPGKLSHGPHKITAKLVPTTPCKPFSKTAVFVHPKRRAVRPVFTG